jgi:aryl-alcohol dehydrogenase-like predicted oxidoreductase
MEYRKFGSTDLTVSVIGFGGWGIGGPAMAGATPIGWGAVDDPVSIRALQRAHELGVTFYDTADFYGLGHSEELIGRVFEGARDIVIGTKVGHRIGPSGEIVLDYSREYILRACEQSLRRLRRETIDYYQLHSARVSHLSAGEAVEALEQLRHDGKIRFWGISLNTFAPEPEAEFLLDRNLGHGFQLVWNILNQRALPIIRRAGPEGFGIIARMPFQFGLLTGKFTSATRFGADDHRSFRLTPPMLATMLTALEPTRAIADELGISRTALALSFSAALPGISTVIPGIKTPEQAEENCTSIIPLRAEIMDRLAALFRNTLAAVVARMERAE